MLQLMEAEFVGVVGMGKRCSPYTGCRSAAGPDVGCSKARGRSTLPHLDLYILDARVLRLARRIWNDITYRMPQIQARGTSSIDMLPTGNMLCGSMGPLAQGTKWSYPAAESKRLDNNTLIHMDSIKAMSPAGCRWNSTCT
ncbi:hypothetical protein UPYG_G00026350 [Umbra pygmaea]|uniref:Uncharacterized protein n=1 Tax=Umbra pygmaea TaxID=75934 RepID=A0ABD0Y919_UMBPY